MKSGGNIPSLPSGSAVVSACNVITVQRSRGGQSLAAELDFKSAANTVH